MRMVHFIAKRRFNYIDAVLAAVVLMQGWPLWATVVALVGVAAVSVLVEMAADAAPSRPSFTPRRR